MLVILPMWVPFRSRMHHGELGIYDRELTGDRGNTIYEGKEGGILLPNGRLE